MNSRYQITLFRDFSEDKRTSMEVYADYLGEWLLKVSDNELQVREYCPQIPKWAKIFPAHSSIQMRISRYLGYPLQAKSPQGDINHIIEDGYAHLLYYPLDPRRTVVTVHDLIPLLAWKGLIPGLDYPHRPMLAEYSLSALSKAAHIVTISKSTMKNLIDHCGCKENNISVVYYGVGDRFRPYSSEQRSILRSRFGFPDYDTHIVLVTGQQRYKNHETCLRVIKRLSNICAKPVVLVRFGHPCDNWNRLISTYDLSDKVIDLGTLSHTKVVQLYNSVDCLLFPSWYEGFGRPPLEAMACGTPVVASNAASLPEVIGDAGFLAAPDDVDDLAHKTCKALEDENIRSSFIEKGKKQASLFTWKRNAEETLRIYKKVAGENR